MKIFIVVLVLTAIIVAIGFLHYGSRNPPKTFLCQLHLANLGRQLELFKRQHGRYPTSGEGLDALVHQPSDPAVALNWVQQLRFLDLDPWGRPYQYVCPGRRDVQTFDLCSLGSDGVESNDDICFSRRWEEEGLPYKPSE